ncbi:MAG: SDR family oxidoreductase [Gemmatimonadota bacterium]|nr:SDR family oxidoreductase [Gemmatimonadota bacterium]
MSHDTVVRPTTTDTAPTILITGASRGIGAAIAERFYAEGASLSLASRTELEVDRSYASERCMRSDVDVRDVTALKDLVHRTEARFGAIDVLINNAGIDEPVALADLSLEHLHEVMAVNFYSAVMLTRFVAVGMMRRRHGRVISISSIAGKEGSPHHVAYVSSKHALIGFTKCAARELVQHGITVNAVCPGLIDTDMLRGFFAAYGAQTGLGADAELETMLSRTPSGQLGSPDDVASLVVFLASAGAQNIVGQAMNTDGGMLQW